MKILRIILSVFLIATLLTSPIEAKTPWSSKPPISAQIDWSHPLSKGLVGCWLMNEGGGQFRDIVNGTIGNKNTGFWKPVQYGISLDANGSSIDCGINPRWDLAEQNFTIIYAFMRESTATTNIRIFHRSAASGARGIVIGAYITPSWRIGIKNSSGEAGGVFLNSDFPAGFNWWGFTYARSTNFTVAYKNGLLYSSGFTGGAGLLWSTTDELYLSNRPSGSTPHSNPILYVYLYNRALSPSEIQQLYQEPDCFIKPTTDWSLLGALQTLFGTKVTSGTATFQGTVQQ